MCHLVFTTSSSRKIRGFLPEGKHGYPTWLDNDKRCLSKEDKLNSRMFMFSKVLKRVRLSHAQISDKKPESILRRQAVSFPLSLSHQRKWVRLKGIQKK